MFRSIKESPDIFADHFTAISLALLMKTASTAAASVATPELFSEFKKIPPRLKAAEIESMLMEGSLYIAITDSSQNTETPCALFLL